MEPSWHQIASQVDPESDTKNDHLLDRPKIDFGWFGSNLPPKKGVEKFRFLVVFGFWTALEAILGPRSPKTSPRGLLGPILEDFELQLGGF